MKYINRWLFLPLSGFFFRGFFHLVKTWLFIPWLLFPWLLFPASKTHDITPINFSCDEAPLLVETWIWKKWAFNWTNNTKNCAYQTIFNTPIKYTHCHESRTKDTIVSRIRLQQTKLNGGLHKIGLHADGLCSTCKILENGYHLIMECVNTNELKKHIRDKLPSEDHFKYEFILNSPSIMDIVANFVIEQKINI